MASTVERTTGSNAKIVSGATDVHVNTWTLDEETEFEEDTDSDAEVDASDVAWEEMVAVLKRARLELRCSYNLAQHQKDDPPNIVDGAQLEIVGYMTTTTYFTGTFNVEHTTINSIVKGICKMTARLTSHGAVVWTLG